MKKRICIFIICITHFSSFSQAFPPDAELITHSQMWKIKLHRPMFGMAKPELVPSLISQPSLIAMLFVRDVLGVVCCSTPSPASYSIFTKAETRLERNDFKPVFLYK